MEQYMYDLAINIVLYFGNMGPFVGMFLIILESIFPILPLSFFIALNILAFGFLFGFIISYIATIIGCLIAFTLVRKLFRKRFYNKIRKNGKTYRFMKKFSKLKLSSLVLLIAMPFTPAFLINICAGLSAISNRKFLASIVIGKISIVYFWGFIGESLLESITDIQILFRIIGLLLFTYVISKLVAQKFEIE